MSKIPNAFKNGKAFIGFLTAGDPTCDKTVEYILAMEEAGCDLIEIGIPFSDPMAEGVVIQDANVRALKHNTTTDDVFEIVRRVREKTDVPLVFLTYINPVFFYGYEEFFKKCNELGIDGIISPDLPKRASEVCNGIVDIIGYIGNEWVNGERKRWLYTRETPTLFAGSRFKYMPDKIPFSYDALVNAIKEFALC